MQGNFKWYVNKGIKPLLCYMIIYLFYCIICSCSFFAAGGATDEYEVSIVAAPDFDYETEPLYQLAFYAADTNFQSETVYLQVINIQ